jgi:hypothetical protein
MRFFYPYDDYLSPIPRGENGQGAYYNPTIGFDNHLRDGHNPADMPIGDYQAPPDQFAQFCQADNIMLLSQAAYGTVASNDIFTPNHHGPQAYDDLVAPPNLQPGSSSDPWNIGNQTQGPPSHSYSGIFGMPRTEYLAEPTPFVSYEHLDNATVSEQCGSYGFERCAPPTEMFMLCLTDVADFLLSWKIRSEWMNITQSHARYGFLQPVRAEQKEWTLTYIIAALQVNAFRASGASATISPAQPAAGSARARLLRSFLFNFSFRLSLSNFKEMTQYPEL